MVPYSNHHPWAHTMVIKFFFSLGHLFTDDINAALAFYTLFQMCFMAFCVAWLISSLQRLGTGNLPCLLILGFYALVPYHGVFAVTIWKDILFSGSMLLFTTALLRLLLLFPKNRRSRNRSGNRKADIFFSLTVYIISGLMLCLFRTNGWYAFLFSLPFLMVAFRHCWKVMLPIHFFVIAAALIIKIPVMNVFHVTQPDFVESVSIPLQQTARVICEDKGLTPEQWNSVHKVIDTTYIQDLYAPGFADNMNGPAIRITLPKTKVNISVSGYPLGFVIPLSICRHILTRQRVIGIRMWNMPSAILTESFPARPVPPAIR